MNGTASRRASADGGAWVAAGWRRAAVYGLGLSGLAAARLLRRRGVAVVGLDRRRAGELDLAELAGDPGFEVAAGAEPAALPAGVDGLVVSPGVPSERPLLAAARTQGLPVVAEVELAFALLDGPVVGVTGSNGKSTTTALTAQLLAASGVPAVACGNIGVPLSACVGGPPGHVFVVELSSFQLAQTVHFRPRAAALLNLSPDHLDRHGDLAEYVAAKRTLFARQGPDDVAVLNADDPLAAATEVAGRRRLFSRRGALGDGAFLAGDTVLEAIPGAPPEELFGLPQLPLAGAHNLENAMAAALLARAAGASRAGIRAGLARFRGLPHRMERVLECGGVGFWNDSKGTNVGATLRSLEAFPDASVHLILGGRNKGADLGLLAPAVARKARRVYLIGEAAAELAQALAGAAPLTGSGELGPAVAAAAAAARPGEAVLLSPACASFDQYPHFAARGEHFRRLVEGLTGAGEGGG